MIVVAVVVGVKIVLVKIVVVDVEIELVTVELVVIRLVGFMEVSDCVEKLVESSTSLLKPVALVNFVLVIVVGSFDEI